MPLTGTPVEFVEDLKKVLEKHNVKAIHVHEPGEAFYMTEDGHIKVGCRTTLEGFYAKTDGKPDLKVLG